LSKDKPKEEKPKGEKTKATKEQKSKEPKEPKEPATVVIEKAKTAEEISLAAIEDFLQLDIRIGFIKECWKVPPEPT